jgi:hypothetical protein
MDPTQDTATLTEWRWTKRRGGKHFVPRPCWYFTVVNLHSGMKECKIPALARNKMFRYQQGAFSFPELQFSSGKLHFD